MAKSPMKAGARKTNAEDLPNLYMRRHSRLHDSLVVYEASPFVPPQHFRMYAPFGYGSREPVLVAHHKQEASRPPPQPRLVAHASPGASQTRATAKPSPLRDAGPRDVKRSGLYALPLPRVTAPEPIKAVERVTHKPVVFEPVAPPPLVSALLPSLPLRKPTTMEYVLPAREEVTDMNQDGVFSAPALTSAPTAGAPDGLFLHADVATGLPKHVPIEPRAARGAEKPLPSPSPDKSTVADLKRNAPGGAGYTMPEEFKPMWRFARHNRARELSELFGKGAHPDIVDEHGNAIMHIACQNGHKRIAKMCLRVGGNINCQNHQGQTPLHYCYEYGFDDLATYLKTKGADDTIRNMFGLTCYHGLHPDNPEEQKAEGAQGAQEADADDNEPTDPVEDED